MRRHSLVAGANALFRAKESARPDRILEDPWAARLGGRDLLVEMLRFARFVVPPLYRMLDALQTVHCVRHASLDRLVLDAVAGGYRQVVVIGAGYDMRPLRFGPQLASVRWFEVDHPATAAQKRARLTGAPEWSERVRVVEHDLARGSLVEALVRGGLDPAAKSCFVLEGIIHYLTRPQLEALLRELASVPCRIVFSFIDSAMYERAPGLFVRLVQLLREIPALHFRHDELEHLLAAHGFARARFWRYDEQVEAFAPVARGRRHGVSQDVGIAESLV
jgi:methyltransferase (TIGR00027 family)